jgi:hypothetical protein
VFDAGDQTPEPAVRFPDARLESDRKGSEMHVSPPPSQADDRPFSPAQNEKTAWTKIRRAADPDENIPGARLFD